MIAVSTRAKRAQNSLLEYVESVQLDSYHRKPLINLSLGDPTLGGFSPCSNILSQALQVLLNRHTTDSYQPCCGNIWARKGIVLLSLVIYHTLPLMGCVIYHLL